MIYKIFPAQTIKISALVIRIVSVKSPMIGSLALKVVV